MLNLALLFLLSAQNATDAYREGVSLLEHGKLAQALPLLEKAAKLEPQNAQHWKALGVAYASAGQLRESLDPFRKACALAPRLLDACYYYGRGLYGTDQYQEAIGPLQTALKFDAAKARAETALGQCYEALGQAAEAETLFRSALARDDSSIGQARLAYGHFLIRQARVTEAIPLLASAQEPETSEARYLFGMALSQAERFEEAASKLERAVALRPGDIAARALLAKVYRRLGRGSDAARLEAANAQAQ